MAKALADWFVIPANSTNAHRRGTVTLAKFAEQRSIPRITFLESVDREEAFRNWYSCPPSPDAPDQRGGQTWVVYAEAHGVKPGQTYTASSGELAVRPTQAGSPLSLLKNSSGTSWTAFAAPTS
jgi:hypothetical protein